MIIIPIFNGRSCLEFYAVSTRLPEEFRLSPEDAERIIAENILENFEVRILPEKACRPFLTADDVDL